MFCDRMDVEKSQRAPPFSFFRHCETFFGNFFHRSIFWCFATMDVKKCERIPFLARQGPALAGTWRAISVVWVFREFDTLFVSLILWVFWDFHVHLLFLSLRYGADLCRSRLVNFFSRPFSEIFEFLKNCPYDFHKILHSHSTLKGAPACAKASQFYHWDVRNMAKISPKMAKKAIFRLFLIFSNSPYGSNEIFYSHSTP